MDRAAPPRWFDRRPRDVVSFNGMFLTRSQVRSWHPMHVIGVDLPVRVT
jgi:hypothetical protein